MITSYKKLISDLVFMKILPTLEHGCDVLHMLKRSYCRFGKTQVEITFDSDLIKPAVCSRC